MSKERRVISNFEVGMLLAETLSKSKIYLDTTTDELYVAGRSRNKNDILVVFMRTLINEEISSTTATRINAILGWIED